MHLFVSIKNTQEKIKEATFELLSTKGYADVSMRDIARKAQTAVGQITYYYKTKEHLIVSVIEEVIAGFTEELRQYIEKSPNKLLAIDYFFDGLLEKEDKLFKVLIDFTAQSLWNETFRSKVKEFFDGATKIIIDSYMSAGVDESIARVNANSYMAEVLGRAVQKVFNDEPSYTQTISVKKERRIFNAKATNPVLQR